MRFFMGFSLVIFLAISIHTQQDSNLPYGLESDKKVGLVLSGGGAKGLAHIGVLKVLEENGIEVDCIAGTSMGSLVGALYSAGYNAKELEEIALSINWREMLSDKIKRSDLPITEKEDSERFLLSFPIENKKISLPKGLIYGQKLSQMFCELLWNYLTLRDFRDMPKPFVCVATDLETGKSVTLSGDIDLPKALRASMSIPSVFTPVEINGKILIDGGQVNNFPVHEVWNLGADYVIGVDVGSPLFKRDKLNNFLKVIEQALNFHSSETDANNRELCDILVKPNLGALNSSSFTSVAELIKRGEEAARKMLPELLKFRKKSVAKSVKKPEPGKREKVKIGNIQVIGLKEVSMSYLMSRLKFSIPAELSPDELNEAIKRVYSTNFFNSVRYSFEEMRDGQHILYIHVEERTDKYLNIGLHYDQATDTGILLNSTIRNFLISGAKLSLNLKLSDSIRTTMKYYINMGWKPGIGIEADINRFKVYSYNNDQKTGSYMFEDHSLSTYLQSLIGNSIAFGAGIEFNKASVAPIISNITPETDIPSVYAMGLFAFLKVDSLDRAYFPNTGFKLNSKFIYITDLKKKTNQMNYFTAGVEGYLKLSERLNLSPSFNFGMSSSKGGERPVSGYFFLGGQSNNGIETFLPFTGVDFMQRIGTHIFTMHLNLRYKLAGETYITLKSSLGATSLKMDDLFRKKDLITGQGIGIGTNTIIGPVEVMVMRSNIRKKLSFYIKVGYEF